MRAVVFAYSEVGYRCLRCLLHQGVDVALVVTHADTPGEKQWYGSVATLAAAHGRPVVTPEDPNTADFVQRLAALAPDFLFSFYYRRLLSDAVLGTARHGGLNMHGSLLPKYRGKAPINWAILNGESETGVSLHYMVKRPDAGLLVDQQAVPIGPDDTALEVSLRAAAAAEELLARCLPCIERYPGQGRALDLTRGSYFGGRTPEDGRIDWSRGPRPVHNLVRAVAPPFPGAFGSIAARPPASSTPLRLNVNRTRIAGGTDPAGLSRPALYVDGGRLYAACGTNGDRGQDGERLELLDCDLNGVPATPAVLEHHLGAGPWSLRA